MKTLIILSAFLLVLSSCTKECPVPDPDCDSTYVADPDPAPDPGDDDPPSSCSTNHQGSSVTWKTATNHNLIK